MGSSLGGAEWLAVTPVDSLAPPAGLHPGVDEWLDIVVREQRAGVVPDVPILVGVDTTPSGADLTIDTRMIDFMNHPMGAAVSSPLTGQVLPRPVVQRLNRS